jgi:hypothetical protein
MTIKLVGPINSGPAVGADGAATVTSYSTQPIAGLVYAVVVKYNGDKPGTTDVVVSTKGTNSPLQTILTLTDKNTDNTFPVRVVGCSNLGVADASATQLVAMDDYLKIVVTGANTDDTVDVWLLMEV